MASVPDSGEYQEPIKIKLFGVAVEVDQDDWAHLPYRFEISENGKVYFKEYQNQDDHFYIDIMPFILDEVLEWFITIEPSYVQFVPEPVGSRGLSVLVAEYTKSTPEEDWINDLGSFVRWRSFIQTANFQASDLDTSIVPISRSTLGFNAFTPATGNHVYLTLLIRQTSDKPLECVNSEIIINLTRKIK